MKKILRYLLIVLAVVFVAVGGFAAFVAIRGIPSGKAEVVNLKVDVTPERIAKGQKLASMLCKGCHMDPNTNKLTGRKMDEVPQFGVVYSKNITQDPEYGIGKWTDGQLAYLLRTGIKPDGTFLPIMAKLSHMSDDDLQSIIAFLRSDHQWVKADNTQHPPSQYSFLSKFITNIGAIKPMPFPKESVPDPDTTNLVKWGEYIALHRVECYSCHSRDFTKNDYVNPPNSEGFFGGGNEMTGMNGEKVVSRNLTMDEETGIGKWKEEDFIKAVKYGVPPNGPALRPPMTPFPDLSDNEARAIYAYLKSLPKIHNKVDRTLAQ
ncbi:c-type cytochrome [Chitinophagaceae bacterium LB-8]|uniref:C-type cytochrome n=1 Tax=Paraflavisolibacter caeni TaxID=2982496 RepID=A0A9X2XZ47_9BACT|nr:c-type cytochrome [Paraflavisolibacter caeni]MCU7551342.1 c-type cytochrome [Paraflavisolibacter caeni]